MECTHSRIKSVNCVIYCDICGVELPAGYIPGKHTDTPAQAAEAPEKAPETAKKTTRRKKV